MSYSTSGFSGNLIGTRNWGDAITPENQKLIRQLNDMYFDLSNAINRLIKKDIVSGADPAANSTRNAFYSIGDITIRTDTDSAWIMTSRTDAENVVWTKIT